ncbi:MAG: hypothetical protein J4G14_08835 [Dehalococcoidia bacterium]|nr:hypothetical protein [Dehalococcoidia bacterium]
MTTLTESDAKRDDYRRLENDRHRERNVTLDEAATVVIHATLPSELATQVQSY